MKKVIHPIHKQNWIIKEKKLPRPVLSPFGLIRIESGMAGGVYMWHESLGFQIQVEEHTIEDNKPVVDDVLYTFEMHFVDSYDFWSDAERKKAKKITERFTSQNSRHPFIRKVKMSNKPSKW